MFDLNFDSFKHNHLKLTIERVILPPIEMRTAIHFQGNEKYTR